MMRRSSTLLFPLLLLAGCGGGAGNAGNAANSVTASVPEVPAAPPPPATGNVAVGDDLPSANAFDRADGSLDRDRFRTFALGACRNSIARNSPNAAQMRVEAYCGCVVDRLVAAGSDDALRASLRETPEDVRVTDRRMGEAIAQCGGQRRVAEPPAPAAAPPAR